jgi:hypothetical protein
MSVVNCKVKYIRPEYDNLKEWMDDPDNVYVARRGVVFIKDAETGIKSRFPEESSIFANPFKIGKDGTREDVINKYRGHIISMVNNDEDFKCSLLELRGKNLGCWCCPEPCHANVLLELIEEYS